MLENINESRTPISDLGEFGLIDHLTQSLSTHHPETLKGIGDDAAVLKFPNDQVQVITTDLLVEGVHFDLAYMPLKHLGYKAVMVNLSDVCAMNAQPKQITVSVALSNRFTVEAIDELYEGIKLACKKYQVDLIGGDTTSSTSGMVISITAIGMSHPDKVVYRNGAQLNDLLVVTGDVGAAYLGLQVLEREKQVFSVNPKAQPDLEPYHYLVERQLKPEARTDIIKLLAELGVLPTSMIDISDGLSSEILHLTKASEVGCSVYEDKLPLDPQVINTCEELNLDSTTIALSGGEDYELLFTINQNDFDRIKGNPNLTVIGHINAPQDGVHLITRAQTQIPIIARGWNPLKSNAED